MSKKQNFFYRLFLKSVEIEERKYQFQNDFIDDQKKIDEYELKRQIKELHCYTCQELVDLQYQGAITR